MRDIIKEKVQESALAVLPICVIILALHFTIAPLQSDMLQMMFVGMALLFVGMILFSIGVELSLLPIGEHVGSALIASRKIVLIVVVLFIFGFVVTAAEPDLFVLAKQVGSIPDLTLIIGISVGVGLFLILAVLRILFHWKLGHVLAIAYPMAFCVALFAADYLGVAIDAAAVTTGPITVPFLLAIGGGFAAVTGGRSAEEDNFGISAICSVGPIMTVLILGMFFPASDTQYLGQAEIASEGGRQLFEIFAGGLWHSVKDVVMVIVPIVTIFLIFQLVKLKLSRNELLKIFVGIGYLMVGLALFLTGVNSGFMPAATEFGKTMGSLPNNWVVVPVAFVLGAGVLLAEPTAYVLVKRVVDITNGAISKSMMLFGMALGVGIAMSLAMVRVLTGVSIWWMIIPGYALSLTLTFLVPNIFVGIGFDAGEVATGAMSAAFVLPFALGVGGSVSGVDAFGIVGLSTMLPPIVVQLIGLVYNVKLKRAKKRAAKTAMGDLLADEG